MEMNETLNESQTLIEIESFIEDIVKRSRKPRNFYEKLTDLLIHFNKIYRGNFIMYLL